MSKKIFFLIACAIFFIVGCKKAEKNELATMNMEVVASVPVNSSSTDDYGLFLHKDASVPHTWMVFGENQKSGQWFVFNGYPYPVRIQSVISLLFNNSSTDTIPRGKLSNLKIHFESSQFGNAQFGPYSLVYINGIENNTFTQNPVIPPGASMVIKEFVDIAYNADFSFFTKIQLKAVNLANNQPIASNWETGQTVVIF